MTEWQDIATAPRDGTWFVITREGEDDFFEVGQFSPRYWTSYEPVGGGLFREEKHLIGEFTHCNWHRATHWCPAPPPLPSPPADARGGGR